MGKHPRNGDLRVSVRPVHKSHRHVLGEWRATVEIFVGRERFISKGRWTGWRHEMAFRHRLDHDDDSLKFATQYHFLTRDNASAIACHLIAKAKAWQPPTEPTTSYIMEGDCDVTSS